ncbi:MAG: hypothetical protein AAGN15_16010 [Cyanobacteria bacterium J06581_3]
MTNKRQLRSPFGNRALVIVAATLVTTGFTASGHFKLQPSGQKLQTVPNNTELVSPAAFERITIGATLAETRSALGAPGDEVSSSIESSKYRWGSLEGAHIICEFEKGVLVSKTRHNF